MLANALKTKPSLGVSVSGLFSEKLKAGNLKLITVVELGGSTSDDTMRGLGISDVIMESDLVIGLAGASV